MVYNRYCTQMTGEETEAYRQVIAREYEQLVSDLLQAEANFLQVLTKF